MPDNSYISTMISALQRGSMVKGTLARPTAQAAAELKNIYLRPVVIKGQQKVSFNHRYKTRDEVKNYTPNDAADYLQQLLGTAFLHADLFTTENDFTLTYDKQGKASFQVKPASHAAPPSVEHDRSKHRLLDPSAPWLRELGLTSAKGEVLPTAQHKWKQINKYLEIIDSLLREHALPKDARIVDMGSGKGYLTFALYDFLTRQREYQPIITGIELRPNLVEFCNQLAQKAGFSGLQFVAQDIAAFQPDRIDMLIALHACDTATDLAIAKGMTSAAQIVVVAPCCHKQIRREMSTRNELAPVLQFGILEERQAEIVTDGIRALMMEAKGYKTQVFEFVATEHTAKNVMITAVQAPRSTRNKADIMAQIEAIKTGFGIRQHYLETLIG